MLTNELKVRADVLGCKRCGLHSVGNGPVPWDGPVPCDIAVVGEAPGREEDEQRRPFVGLSGRLARSWVEPRFGEVAWLNVASCFPNRTPTKNEVDACRVNLIQQLEIIQPRLLLLFGGVAASAWVEHRIGEVRGRWFRCPIGARLHPMGLATWHPAAVLRNRSLEVDVLDDLRVFRESLGEDGIPPYVYRPCIKCGSCVDTQVDERGIAWCGKHYAWKVGTAGRGRKSQSARPRRPTRSSSAKDRTTEMF
jgi:uracil-DNA glycosylase family 4